MATMTATTTAPTATMIVTGKDNGIETSVNEVDAHVDEIDTSAKFYPHPFPDGLPTVELARLSLAKILAGDEEEANTLFELAKDKGFCYLDLRTHEMGVKLAKEAEEMHEFGKKFFGQHVSEKRQFKLRPAETGLLDTGYKEFSWDAEGNPQTVELIGVSQFGLLSGQEDYVLPPFLAPYRPKFCSMLRGGNVIQHAILRILEKKLQIPPGTFTSIHKLEQQSGSFLRILNYPVPADGIPHQGATNPPHRDATSITLLFTWQGGLQITNHPNEYKSLDTVPVPEDSWFYVPPVPGHVIMNLGDAMHIMTNGTLASGTHRVVSPPGPQGQHQRLAVALFGRPWFGASMKTVDSPLVRPGQYLDKEMTVGQWGQEKVLRLLSGVDKIMGKEA